MAKAKAIVTRESIQAMLNNPNPDYVALVVGRALVRLFERQTEAEKASNDTNVDNGIGFAGCDARTGTLSAKYFLKHKTLLPWQVARWTKVEASGFPKICKYWRQLNEIALKKQQDNNK